MLLCSKSFITLDVQTFKIDSGPEAQSTRRLRMHRRAKYCKQGYEYGC